MSTAETIEFLLRHADVHCQINGTRDIAIRPVVRAGCVEWWASIDVLTASGSREWYPCSKGAKTPEGALSALAREVVAERRAA